MGYIEDNYKVLMSDEKLNDFGKKYVTAAYYLYKKQYDKSISIFNEIRDYVGYSIITIYARTFAVEFHNFFITIKDPHDPNILFINPYKKEHQEYQRRLDQYNLHLQTAASTRSLIDWASNLNEPDISKFKAKCLYYGSLKYEKNPVEAFRLLHKFRNSFTANDQDCIDLYEKLKQELGKTAKDIIKASH